MWNDLSAYLCGCVDPWTRARATCTSRGNTTTTRRRDEPRDFGRHPADAGRAGARRLEQSELEDVRSPRPAFVRQKSIAAARVPPIPSSTPAARRLPPPPTPAVATDVSDVAIVRPDGRGVFGALRLGVERSTRQLVSVEDVEGEVQALRRAARAACPQLVAVHGVGPAPKGGARVVTEYLDGARCATSL